MAATSQGKGGAQGKSQGKGGAGAALDSVKTKEKLEAKSAEKAAAAKSAKASAGSGDSPKRQGDKLEKARDAAAGRAKG